MAKFEAKEIDLDLELILLNKEEIKLSPKIELSTKNIMKIVDHWQKIEEPAVGSEKVVVLAKELALVYDKEEDWWLENLDVQTLSDVLQYVAETVGGLKKRGPSES
jgi:hypothetical protein